jgi:hypothetical protein
MGIKNNTDKKYNEEFQKEVQDEMHQAELYTSHLGEELGGEARQIEKRNHYRQSFFHGTEAPAL